MRISLSISRRAERHISKKVRNEIVVGESVIHNNHTEIVYLFVHLNTTFLVFIQFQEKKLAKLPRGYSAGGISHMYNIRTKCRQDIYFYHEKVPEIS